MLVQMVCVDRASTAGAPLRHQLLWKCAVHPSLLLDHVRCGRTTPCGGTSPRPLLVCYQTKGLPSAVRSAVDSCAGSDVTSCTIQHSGKLLALVSLLERVASSDRRVVVVCKFAWSLSMVQRALESVNAAADVPALPFVRVDAFHKNQVCFLPGAYRYHGSNTVSLGRSLCRASKKPASGNWLTKAWERRVSNGGVYALRMCKPSLVLLSFPVQRILYCSILTCRRHLCCTVLPLGNARMPRQATSFC